MNHPSDNAALAGSGYWKRLWLLFWSYVKITALVVGGGYAIIAASEAVFVRRKRWLTEDEMLDIIAVTQTVPGILACNSAIGVGLRVAGFGGALAALAGAMLPSIVVISLVAYALAAVPDALNHPRVQGAFTGVVACIVGMVAATLIRMGRKVLKGIFEWTVAAAGVVAMAVFDLNPGWVVLAAIPCGIFYVLWKQRRLAP